MTYSDDMLRDILGQPRKVAMVGASPNPIRPSFFVGQYLTRRGFRVTPVNPRAVGQVIFGQPTVADLAEAPEDIEMLDVFRKADAVPALVEAALARFKSLSVVWLQIGVISPEAQDMCRDANVHIIQDRCPKIEHQRLFGNLRMAGMTTGIISSKL